MARIRLDDDYIYHPKFTALSASAFRLWHEGIAYCRKLLTDGIIPRAALKTFRYAKRESIQELTTPISAGVAPLWEPREQGYHVHDYLDWNASRDEEQRDREAAKRRMRAFRGKSSSSSVTPFVTPTVTPLVPGQGECTVSGSEEKGSGEKPSEDPFRMRAGRFLERYAELFYQHRRGARYHARPHLDFPKACDLVHTWADDARLEKLAVLVLTTDDEWIAGTDRGFAVFAARASWADDRLRAWEETHGVTA